MERCKRCNHMRIDEAENDLFCILIDDYTPDELRECPILYNNNSYLPDVCFSCKDLDFDITFDDVLECEIHNCKYYFHQKYAIEGFDRLSFFQRLCYNFLKWRRR